MKRVFVALFFAVILAGSACAQDISAVKSNAVVDGTNTFFPYDTINYFTVTGRVTSPFLSFTNTTEIFIQDTSSGIRVMSVPGIFQLETNIAAFPPGVQVTVYGKIAQFSGMRVIRPEWYGGNPYDTGKDFYISGTTTSPIAPEVTTIANHVAQGEEFEGKLIRINGLKMGTNAWPYQASSSLSVTDSTGTITLYVDRNTDIDGQLPPTNTFDLIGLAAQYTTNAVPSNGYEIIARSYADFIQTTSAEAPSILAQTSVVSVVSNAISAYVVGRDRNAEDTLVLATNAAPSGSAFVKVANRNWDLRWTPDGSFVNTTNDVVFNVSDGTTAVTGSIRVVVRAASGGPNQPWINEFHYDNDSTDVGEGVELAGRNGLDLSSYYILLYNGNGGVVYGSNACSGVIDDEGNGYGAVWFPIAGLQNDMDGIALCHKTNGLLQFLSYEGSFTATTGTAAGVASVDVGVSESGSEPVGQSLQLQGDGTNYEAFTWSGPMAATPGEINGAGQTINGSIPARIVYSGLSLSPAAPAPDSPFDIVAVITPNYNASSLVPTAWYRINAGAWSNIVMSDQGGSTNKTSTQVPAQPNGALIEYYISTTFDGPGTNSPTVSVTNSYVIVNLPPVFAAISNQLVTESNALTFAVSATDPELDPITLSVSNAPAGSTFTSTNGNGDFYWTNAAPIGVYTTTFYAADAAGISSTTITIRVSAPVMPTLVYYDFDLGTAVFTPNPAYVTSYLSASAFTVDSGFYTNYQGNPTAGRAIGGTGWNTSNHYWAFTLTVSNGYQLAVGLMRFDTYRSATGPQSWMLRYSVDGYASNLASGTNAVSSWGETNVAYLSLIGLTSAVTFRVYGTNASGSTGTWRLDNVRLLGSVTALAAGDVDGIPVSWWDRYGIPEGERVATNNPDGDVDNNYEEFVADTVPTNNASYFVYKITNMTGIGTMQLLVGPPTTNSRVYDAFWCTSLVVQGWTPLNFNVPGMADGSSFFLTVTNDAAGRFYRTGVKIP